MTYMMAVDLSGELAFAGQIELANESAHLHRGLLAHGVSSVRATVML
jgi:hypothetical protein